MNRIERSYYDRYEAGDVGCSAMSLCHGAARTEDELQLEDSKGHLRLLLSCYFYPCYYPCYCPVAAPICLCFSPCFTVHAAPVAAPAPAAAPSSAAPSAAVLLLPLLLLSLSLLPPLRPFHSHHCLNAGCSGCSSRPFTPIHLFVINERLGTIKLKSLRKLIRRIYIFIKPRSTPQGRLAVQPATIQASD